MKGSAQGPAGIYDQNPLFGIAMKVTSVALFVAMQSFIKAAGELPTGQIAFFRSFFAIPPILILLAYRRELPTAMRTRHALGHFLRGLVGITSMLFGFFALTRLPLAEAIALSYAHPLILVVFSAMFLGEPVKAFRWSAVVVGMAGVLIISWPKLTVLGSGHPLDRQQMLGLAAALCAATLSAVATLLVRRLVATERTATIVLWFSLTASLLALLSIPFGWSALSLDQATSLIASGLCGGVAQIFMTESYRHAPLSTVAPFEYTSMLIGIGVGFFLFGDVPTVHMLVGSGIVIGAGIFIIWREQRLGLERAAARKVVPPQ